MRSYEILPSLLNKLSRIAKKDRALYEQVIKKVEEICSSGDVDHYKNLRYSLKELKRVHIGHFVLVFEYLKAEDKIIFTDFGHHDKIY